MIEADIKKTLTDDSAVAAIVSTRVFFKNPINKQSSPYLVYSRDLKFRDMVSERNRFQIVAFSDDTEQLETLCRAVIASFENKKTLNGNFYYSVAFLGQSDGREKLDDGMFWSILNFEFKQTT